MPIHTLRGVWNGGHVDYNDAKSLGDEAERRVKTELARLSGKYGFVALHKLLIQVAPQGGGPTTQLDHVVVDRYGVVVIETKKRSALIRGLYTDKNWTACYRGNQNKPFPNPMRQNDQQRGHLFQALEKAGTPLPIERIRGWIAFVDADLSKLVTDGQSEKRVFDVDQLESAFESRANFVLQTPLSADEQLALVSAIQALDRSGDPETESAHAGYRQQFHEDSSGSSASRPVSPAASSPRCAVPQPSSAPGRPPVRPQPYSGGSRPSPARKFEPGQSSRMPLPVALGLVGLAAVGLIGWGANQLLSGSVGPLGWMFILAILLALLGNPGSSRRRGRRRSSSTPQPAASMETRLLRAVVGMILAAGLLAAAVGIPFFMLRGMAQSVAGTPAPSAVEDQPVPDVGLAKQRMLEANPDLYGRLSNPDAPSVGVAGSYVTYQWDAVQQNSSNSVEIKPVSLTLDGTGQVVGFSW